MSFYVYIIKSEVDGSFYKGFTEDPIQRLNYHNQGSTQSTRRLIPWMFVYIEECPSKKDALIREKNLKKASRERIEALILHPKNIVKQFRVG